MNMLCIGGPWDRQEIYISDGHITAVLDIPLPGTLGGTVLCGRYARQGDCVASADCGKTTHLAAYWEPVHAR